MKNRSELREIIMRVLYQIDVFSNSKLVYDVNELIKEQLEVENPFVNDTIEGVIKNKTDIIQLANKYLGSWPMDRLNKVDQAIICLAIYELKYTDIPSIVAINEAIELSKDYSDEKVTKMINAILDEIYHNEEINERQ